MEELLYLNVFNKIDENFIKSVLSFPHLEPVSWFVLDLEGDRLGEEVQPHVADLDHVLVSVGDGHPARNHVGVSDSLNLNLMGFVYNLSNLKTIVTFSYDYIIKISIITYLN